MKWPAKVYFFCLTCLQLFVTGSGVLATGPIYDCPVYVDEGHDLDCQCRGEGQVTWKGHGDTSRLSVKAVSRRDNGTEYTCQMVWGSRIYSTTYTLQVAYGPSEKTTHIEGPSYFITDGTKKLTLSCIAEDVNPKPIITWLFGPCNHGTQQDTCTFRPDIERHDNISITCRAMNARTSTVETATVSHVLHLKYPPMRPPVIDGHTEGQIHKAGDNLTCTVTGGSPLVEKVNFTCRNPSLEDKEDSVAGMSVFSSLTVPPWELRERETVCTCSALWKPQPALYTQDDSVSFAIQVEIAEPPNTTTEDFSRDKEGNGNYVNSEPTELKVLLWILGSILFAVIAGIVCFILCKRNLKKLNCLKRQNRSNKSHASQDVGLVTQPGTTLEAGGGNLAEVRPLIGEGSDTGEQFEAAEDGRNSKRQEDLVDIVDEKSEERGRTNTQTKEPPSSEPAKVHKPGEISQGDGILSMKARAAGQRSTARGQVREARARGDRDDRPRPPSPSSITASEMTAPNVSSAANNTDDEGPADLGPTKTADVSDSGHPQSATSEKQLKTMEDALTLAPYADHPGSPLELFTEDNGEGDSDAETIEKSTGQAIDVNIDLQKGARYVQNMLADRAGVGLPTQAIEENREQEIGAGVDESADV